MALALYRKYRPRTFAEIIGQEHVTEPLSQALRSGRLNHAYLFSGPRGCGKTSSARILARSLNCERGPTPEPCGECQSCRDLAPDGAGSIDVIEIDAASHGGVDDARDLRERAFFAPVSSRFKVYVIDEAHMVSSAGFNALLKLVEEPPDYVKFVFATTEPEKVLGTIKSRTHHYPFRLIPPGVLRPYLEQLTAAEGVKVEPAVFPLVVRAGAGSARDSLSVLDQLIAGAGDEGVTYNRAVALLGVTDVALIDEMCDALAADDGRSAYGVIDRVVEAGHDPRRFASDLLERLRDLIVLQQVPDAVTKGLLDAPHDQLDKMGAQATQLGQATLSRYADIVHDGLTEMRGTTAPRLLLELITARMLLPGADASSSALLQRLERMERRLQAGGVPAATEPTPAATAPTYAPAPVRGSTDGGNRGLDYIRGAATAPPAAAAAPPPQPPGAWDEAPAPQADPAPAAPPAAPAAPPAPAAAPEPSAQPAPTQAYDPPAAAPAPPAPTPSASAPRPQGGGGGLDADAMRRAWPDVLALVNDKSKKTGAILRDATVQDVEDGMLVLGFKYATHANMLNAGPEVLLSALQELFGGRWQVRCEVGGQPGGGGGGNRPAPPKPTPQPSGPSGGPAPAGVDAAGSAGPAGQYRAAPQQARADQDLAQQPHAMAQTPAPAPTHSPDIAARAGQQPAAVRSAGGVTAVVAQASPAQDDGWPAPAVPGGAAVASAPTPTVVEDDGWPEMATPGHAAQAAAAPATSGGHEAAYDNQAPTGLAQAGTTAPAGTTAGAALAGAAGNALAGAAGNALAGATAGWTAANGSAMDSSAGPAGSAAGLASSSGGMPSSPAGFAGSRAGSYADAISSQPTPDAAWAAGSAAAAMSSSTMATSGGAAGTDTSARNANPARPRQGASSAVERAREAASRAAASANGARRGTTAGSGPGGVNGSGPAPTGAGAANAGGRAGVGGGPGGPGGPGGVNGGRFAGAGSADSAWEGTGADEPPWDPDYDSPVTDTRFPGLDPGDELLDDATEVRETSEEAALRLLIETLGAEKIGETTA
ncbi:MAG TPA: DNA polymerase III subunit gamma and tau [Dactylosporangium sp.]|nr:DNA polymerase III subunit gamma and tau [Dactylosporangium sp.]